MKTSTLFILSAIIGQTVAFTPSLPLSSSSSSSSSIILFAKKKSNQKKTTNKGFGISSTTSKPSTQTRSVSGYTGSGTKPLAKAANTFDQIRKIYGKDATSDIYMRSPLNDEELFWYVGKVVRKLDLENCIGDILPNEMEAVLSQKRLIMEYAKHQLRPQNFGGPYSSSLELWIAPGDSEMDVVQNKISLRKVVGSTKDLREGFRVEDVGFNPEIYVGDEQKDGGLRVKRDENGDPVKDVFEING